MSTDEAVARLGIKPASLYAYVSRGLVTRHLGPDGRSSRFDPLEIDALARRGRPRRSSRNPVVEIAVESAITSVATGPSQRHGHSYRGHSAIALAGRASFEEVAGLLLDGALRAIHVPTSRSVGVAASSVDGLDALARMRWFVERAAAADPLRADLSAESIRGASAGVLAAVASAAGPANRVPTLWLADGTSRSGTIAGRLSVALAGSSRPPRWVVEGVNAALVLLADHELATSTLAARVAASTRADPSACVVAALATLSGPLHGTASSVVRDALASPHPAEYLAERAAGGRLPGFGHPLYEGDDPRSVALLARVRAAHPRHSGLIAADRLVASVRRRSGVPPNVDLGLAVFVSAADLAPDAGAVLFAVARTAGWLAHVAEEYASTPLRYRSRAVRVP